MKHLPAPAVLLLALLPLAAAADRQSEGRAAYDAHCASCHDSGTDGAPVLGRAEDWQGRSRLWETVLLEHAEEGYLEMPPRGGSDAGPYEVDVAAEYLLSASHPQMPRD